MWEWLGGAMVMAAQLLALAHSMVAMYMARRDRSFAAAAGTATSAFSDLIRAQVAGRRKELGDDLLSGLIRA